MVFVVKKRILVALSIALLAALASPEQLGATESDEYNADSLAKGEIIVDTAERETQTHEKMRFVTGKILVSESPEKVWAVITNPYEFEAKICPRMHNVKVLLARQDKSVISCTVDTVRFFPQINYRVESTYSPCSRIDFRRIGGMLREFRGSWLVRPLSGGKATELEYSMFIDPGFPVPQWIIREAIKVELPRMLKGVRNRVTEQRDKSHLERRSILASRLHAS